MDLANNFLPLIIVGIVIAVALVAFLIVMAVRAARSRKHPPVPPALPTPTPQSPPEGSEPAGEESPRAPPEGGGEAAQAPAQTAAVESEVSEVSEAPVPQAEEQPEPDVVPQEVEVEAALEVPEAPASRMQRLRARMARSGGLGAALLSILSRGDLAAADWEEIEDSLLLADVGLAASEQILDQLRTEVKVRGKVSGDEAQVLLRRILLDVVQPDLDRSLNLDSEDGVPASVLVVGVNGTGKTTTVGKLGRLLRAEDKTVLMGAADTFRAAAAEQLTTWGERVGVDVVSAEQEGGDPAAVAFEAVRRGIDENVDVVLVDTAGRLQNKSTLMDELGKVKRVMEKQAPVTEVLLVLDATTGQNGMRQAQVFAEAVGITGVVLTKLDGSAKGGIVVSVQRELGVPVKLVGLGEGPDDLAPFDAESFVSAIVDSQ